MRNGEVKGILSRAMLEAGEVAPELTATYQHAALILAADRDLTAADRAGLDNLQHAFQLKDHEATAARAAADIFTRSIREAVADGRWSPADQATADATATALGIPDPHARVLFTTAGMAAAVRASFDAAVADQRPPWKRGGTAERARGRFGRRASRESPAAGRRNDCGSEGDDGDLRADRRESADS